MVTVGLALMTVVSAVSGLNVALPEIARDTGASQTQLAWIVDAYTVVFAGLLFLAGALGDRYGRRGILLAGLLTFAGAATAALFVSDPGALIAVRAVMGLGAAGIMPTTLSVITTSFPAEERPRAIGLWVGIAGAGAIVGLLASGTLLEFFSWNSFFALNIALALAGLVGTLAFIPASREAAAERLDAVGGVLALVAVAGVVFGIIESADRGWSDPRTWTPLAIGGAAVVAFGTWERAHPAPLLDPRLFRIRGFSAGGLAVMMQFFAMFGLLYAVLQYLQFVVGHSPLGAAVRLLPMAVVLVPTARIAPRIAQRVGFKRMGFLGLLLLGAGLLVLSTLDRHLDYRVMVGGLMLVGAGAGVAGTPATTAITVSLPRAKQGVASAVNDVSRELGSAIGIAVLGSTMAATYRDNVAAVTDALPAPLANALESSVAATQAPQLAAMGQRGSDIVLAAQNAFVEGVSHAMLIAAGVVFVAAFVVLFLAPGATPSTRPTPGDHLESVSEGLDRRGSAGLPRLT